MAAGEGAQSTARQAPPPKNSNPLEEAILNGVRREIEAIVTGLERHADNLIRLYKDLDMDGEREAAAFRKVASDLRDRLDCLTLTQRRS